MTKPADIASIEKGTKTAWSDWVAVLNDANGQNLTHAQIAVVAQEYLQGKIESPGWWAQSVAVAYEQHIGRRAPGQRPDGTYEASVTKTVMLPKDEAYARVCSRLEDMSEMLGVEMQNKRTTSTPIRHYWKANGSDGSKVIIGIEQRGDKSLVAVQVQALASADKQQALKEFWKNTLTETFEEV